LGIAYFFLAGAFLAGAFLAVSFLGLFTRLGACFSHNDFDIVFLSER